jgi:hypothetical protein
MDHILPMLFASYILCFASNFKYNHSSEAAVEQEAFLFEEKRQQEQIGIAAAEAARRRLAQVRALLTNYQTLNPFYLFTP